MSTSTRNPFSLLDEDYDPNAAPAEKSQPKTEEKAPKEIVAKQTTSKKRDPTRQTASEARRGNDSAARGERNGKFENRRDNAVGHEANAAKSTEDTVSRGTARGRGRGRGSGNRREFDRRNASGKTDTAKATEQSWGNEAEAQQSATAEPVDARDPSAPEADEAAPQQDAVPAPVEEEEDTTVSYEEYLKQKADKAKANSTLNLRAANEGSDASKWAGEEYTRSNQDDAYFAGVQKAKSGSQKERKQKEMLEIEQRFYQAPSTRGRGMFTSHRVNKYANSATGEGRGRGRGSRGAPRGGARGGAPRGEGRGQTRGKSSQGADLTLSDDTAFPSLS